MRNRNLIISMLLVIAGLIVLSCPVRGADLSQDMTADTTIVYRNVDVNVEYEWRDGEEIEAVDAHLIYQSGVMKLIELYREDRKVSYFSLHEGMTMRIYNHVSGKLILELRGGIPVVL